MTATPWTATKAEGPGNYWNVFDPDSNFVCFAKEPDAKRVVAGLNQRDRLKVAAEQLANKTATLCGLIDWADRPNGEAGEVLRCMREAEMALVDQASDGSRE